MEGCLLLIGKASECINPNKREKLIAVLEVAVGLHRAAAKGMGQAAHRDSLIALLGIEPSSGLDGPLPKGLDVFSG